MAKFKLVKLILNSRRRSHEPDIPLLPLYASQTTPRSPPASPPNARSPQISSLKMSPSLQPTEPLVSLARQTSHLQNHIQTLLDAQSEGLLAGLGAEPGDTASSTSSRTRTPSTSEHGSKSVHKPPPVVPVRQPKPKKIGLRAARRGISRAIADLATVKNSEVHILQAEFSKRSDAISSADRMRSKSSSLRAEIDSIESQPTSERIINLKETEQSLGREIHDLETRLFEMKARQRHMLGEISTLENSVQSQLSSYKNALQLAEKEAREFLARPPPELDTALSGRRKEGVWVLPAQRRTLELAKNEWTEEQKMLESQMEGVVQEKEALDNGGKMWDDVLREIGEVETLLQNEMKGSRSHVEGQRADQGMDRVLSRMRDAQNYLRKQLEVAEEKHWNLLVVSIGAELEALVEGWEVLKDSLGFLESSTIGHKRTSTNRDSSANPAQDLSNGMGRVDSRSEEEDDRPGPDLLISQDDI